MCLSKDVTGTLRNYHSPQFVTCFYTGCLSKDVTGALLSLFFVSFCFHTVCLSKDVTGHCSFCCIALPRSCFTVLLGSALSFLICFWTSSHGFFIQCVCPIDVAGALFLVLSYARPPSAFFCISSLVSQCVCPKT